MNDQAIPLKVWTDYGAQRERKERVEAVLADLERSVADNPSLLRTKELFAEWRSLAHAFPEKPLDVSIAVIGVFRSGKSTLINALLGASLLPAAHAATTATITKIRYRPSGYVVRVRYIGPTDESFRRAQEDLRELLARPLDEVMRDLRDPNVRGEVEALLGMYGAIGEHGVLDEARLAVIHGETQRSRALPRLPHEHLLGQETEHAHEELTALEQAVRPYVMFSGATGQFDLDAATRQFMISSVVIEGPFSVLASPGAGAGNLTLVDSPGLEDPRPFVKKMVYDYLRAADCVLLNCASAVLSASDVSVLRLLLNETLQRKLIVTLGKIDNLGASEEELRVHVEKQRKMLEARVTELCHGGAVEARRFVDETPLLPVVALAALQRAQQQRGVELDKHARRRLEDYKTALEDGTLALFDQIRRTLDASSRLSAVVRRADESLTHLITNASAALSAGIEDRRLNAEQLQQKLDDLSKATDEARRGLDVVLETKLSAARAQWTKRREEDRARFDAKLAELALRQMGIARGFIAAATATDWRHWRRLRAVAARGDFADWGQDSQLRDDIAAHALGGVPSLLRSAIGSILATTAESVGCATELSGEAANALGASTMDRAQVAEIQVALHDVAGAELRSATTEYRDRMNALAAEVFERNAVAKMSTAAERIVLEWISAVEDDGGRGVQSRMHHALDDGMTRFVTNLPGHVRELFGSDIDGLFRAAEEGAVEVYERVAKKVSGFLTERIEQLDAIARRAQTTEADALDQERAVLVGLRDRLAAASVV